MFVGDAGAGGTPPAAPTLVTAAKVPGQLRVNTTWQDNATDETGYEADKRTNGGAWTILNHSLGVNEDDVSDLGVALGDVVEHRIRAVKGALASAWVISNAVCVGDSPSSPSLTASAGPNPATQVTLDWAAPSGTWATTEIQRSTNAVSGFVTIATTTAPTVTFTDTPPSTGRWYYRARNHAGVCSLVSAYSSAVPWDVGASPVVDAPVLSVTVLDENRLQLDWTAVAHATQYQLAASDTAFPPSGPDWSNDVIATTSSPTVQFVHAGLNPKTTRFYEVRGINTTSQGPRSNAVNATTWPLNPIAVSAVLDCGSHVAGTYDVVLTLSADGSGRNMIIRGNPNGAGYAVLQTVGPGTTTLTLTAQPDRTDFDVDFENGIGTPQVFGSGSATLPSWCAHCGDC